MYKFIHSTISSINADLQRSTAIILVSLAVAASASADRTDDRWLAYLQENAIDLETEQDLAPLIERLSRARVVLLGESTHGTKEYYQWRKRITQRLIEDHGFNFIAVEGDWPSCYAVNRYVKQLDNSPADAAKALEAFNRWPQWMWANPIIEKLATWLAEHNAELPGDRRVGFYGLDVYAMMDSIDAVIDYLDGEDADRARSAYAHLLRYRGNEHGYVRNLAQIGQSSQRQTEQMVEKLRRLEPDRDGNPEAYRNWFNAKIDALAVRNGERHYRAMLQPGPDSWNRRAEHMKETLSRLLNYYGPDSKAIVWAHNTHVGDARASAMSAQGMVNIGQLTRRRYGRDRVAIVGFGTYRGEVRAGSRWGQTGEIMRIPPAVRGSYDALFNQLQRPAWMILFDKLENGENPLYQPMYHRAIGVVYNPLSEYPGNYVPTIMPQRYDALIYFRQTHPLDPLTKEIESKSSSKSKSPATLPADPKES